jgi:serine/threonine protein kinase
VRHARDVARALQCAHEAGIVHRDVKPANLIISSEGATKLADFGIAKGAAQTRVTQTGAVLGTIAYLSPEQAMGAETDAASDIYALAVCTYQMLSGQLPHAYRSVTELALKQREERPAPITDLNPLVPPELDRVVRSPLSLDPRLRYRSAHELADALRSGLAGRDDPFATRVMEDPEAVAAGAGATGVATVVSPPAPVSGRAAPRRRRRFAVAALLAVSVAAAAAGTLAVIDYNDAAPVVEQTVERQIDELRDFIERHRR